MPDHARPTHAYTLATLLLLAGTAAAQPQITVDPDGAGDTDVVLRLTGSDVNDSLFVPNYLGGVFRLDPAFDLIVGAGQSNLTNPLGTKRGVLSLSGGSILEVENNVFLGADAAFFDGQSFQRSSGVLTLDGPGTTLRAGRLLVGRFGSGEATLTNGARLEMIGQRLDIAGQSDSSGKLEILSGSSARLGNRVVIGGTQREGATGMLSIDGQFSRVDSLDALDVGSGGFGELRIDNGGAMFVDGTNGDATGFTGTLAHVIGYEFDNDGDLNNPAGIASVRNGSLLVLFDDRDTLIGAGSGTAGILSISLNSGARVGGNVFVGSDSGVGTMVVESGSSFTIGSFTTDINGAVLGGEELLVGVGGPVVADGSANGTIGNATVTGADSTLLARRVSIGREGAGSLSVENGGSVVLTELMQIGLADGNATVTVTGDGSRLTSSGSFAGSGFDDSTPAVDGVDVSAVLGVIRASQAGATSTGRLEVSDRARVDFAGGVIVGNSVASTGELTVGSGGSVTLGDSAIIGHLGTGSLTVDGSADAGATPSTFSTTRDLILGARTAGADATAFVSGGGVVEVGALLRIGDNGTGSFDVTGAGSSVTASQLIVGNGDTGSLSISDGASVSVTTTTGSNIVGFGNSNGDGSVNISSGGSLSFAGRLILSESESNSTVTVDGAGSRLEAAVLEASPNGTSTITVRNGAAAEFGPGISRIGDGIAGFTVPDTSGQLNVESGGSVSFEGVLSVAANGEPASSSGVSVTGSDSTLYVGRLDLGGTSNGQLDITDGGSVVTEVLFMSAGGSTSQTSGITINGQGSPAGATLTVNNFMKTAGQSNGQFSVQNGSLSVLGAQAPGQLVLAGGAGDASADINAGGRLDVAGEIQFHSQAAGRGSLTINGGDVTAERFTNTEEINGTGVGGATFTFNSGSLTLTGDQTLDASTVGFLNGVPGDGPMDIGAARAFHFTGDNDLTGGEIDLNGGTLTFGDVNIAGGDIDFNSGTLNLRSDQTLDAGRVNDLGITGATLNTSQTLNVAAARDGQGVPVGPLATATTGAWVSTSRTTSAIAGPWPSTSPIRRRKTIGPAGTASTWSA